MILNRATVFQFFSIFFLVSGAVRADVFDLGGTRDPATGTWTGVASVEFVPVGDAGNAADPDTGYGKVDYAYNIGKYDVTAGQYCEFLNAVAKISDPYGLYNTNMDMAQRKQGCNIIRNGTAGNFSYTVATDWANRPVNFVSWGDAARFCNWLQNGQKTGSEDATTTELGAYALGGATTDAALMKVVRSANAQYFIPTLDESYKAAYYDPNKLGLGQPGYWNYPTRHDNPPINLLDPNGTNNANFYDDVNHTYTIGGPYYRTEVGAFAASPSPYGTYDQGGNITTWNETALDNGIRSGYGSCFSAPRIGIGKWLWGGAYPTTEDYGGSFRVGNAAVPEPSILSMLIACTIGSLLLCRKT